MALPRFQGNPARAGSGPRFEKDRKSTRLNSSHLVISYAVFCLKKKIKLAFVLVCVYAHDSPIPCWTPASILAATPNEMLIKILAINPKLADQWPNAIVRSFPTD